MTSLTSAVAADIGRQHHAHAPCAAARGFSLVELLIVIAVIAILAGVGVGVTPTIIAFTKGDSANQQVAKFLKEAREASITRHRNVEVRFLVGEIQSAIVNVPGPGTTVLATMPFEGGLDYQQFSGVPDTPDLFSTATAGPIQPPSAATGPVMFTTEGSFVDVNGDSINLTLFFAIHQQPGTATAITILGTTAAVRTWRWDLTQWQE